MKILLSGGGTGGPVTPLLAVVEALREKDPTVELLWLGTENGPEKQLVESQKIRFKSIAAGKLRRYFSWYNFVDPFKILFGFLQALKIIIDFKPSAILSAGGFVSVPVIWAGAVLKIPALIHQQDHQVGLATKLVAPFVKFITLNFKETAKFLPPEKARWTGQPVRDFLFEASRDQALRFFDLSTVWPTVLITGGGTGAAWVNLIVAKALPRLLAFSQVIHLTGKGKEVPIDLPADILKRYRQYEFLNKEMAYAFAAADVVVSRAGASASFEIASLGKPAILIPLPDSPQEQNAEIFAQNKAAVVIKQSELSVEKLTSSIKQLIDNIDLREALKKNVREMNTPDAADKIADLIWKIKK